MTVQDLERVGEIDSYRVVGQPPRRDLEALVALAAQVCDVSSAAINLITVSEQVQVAAYGVHPSVCSREDSMCAAILHEPEPVVVADARLDRRFADNPFVTGEIGAVRFYAATHLVTPSDVPIGTLCVFDDEPRVLTAQQASALSTLADRIVDVLELGRRSRQLEQSLEVLRETRDELRRSNEELAAFAGQAAHDLRNPLTSVSMSLQMLAEEPAVRSEDDVRWMVDRALSGATRMDELIEDLLSYGQVGGRLRVTDVDLADVMDAVRADLAGTLDGARLEVGALPTIAGDATQLRLVLQNLVANAVKFTRPHRTPHISVTARSDVGGWRVEVADNGPGVAPADRQRVFEPLVRADRSTDGVGLGLAICARAVRAHGGTIRMEASPGGGALVWFEVPAG
ncbi:MAG: ATP-binding protein [Nocardioides sp.]